jgi:hypothetical protein
LKNNFLSRYYTHINNLEINYLIVLVNNFIGNYSRILTFQNYSFTFLRNILKKNKFFPSIFFDLKIYDLFKFRWSFFGFSSDKPTDGILVNCNKNILNVISFISRLFILPSVLQNFIFLEPENNFLNIKSTLRLPSYFFKTTNINKNLMFFRTLQTQRIFDFTSLFSLTKFFNTSNFYKPFTFSKNLSSFNYLSHLHFKNPISFNYKLLTNFFFKKSKKRIFKSKNLMLSDNLSTLHFYSDISIFEKFKFFKNKIISHKNVNYNFNVFFLKIRSYLIFSFAKINFFEDKFLKFLLFKVKKFVLSM